jgi:hypothetical protein
VVLACSFLAAIWNLRTAQQGYRRSVSGKSLHDLFPGKARTRASLVLIGHGLAGSGR